MQARTPIKLLPLVIWCTVALASPLASQEEPCTACNDTGEIACPSCAIEFEQQVRFCSHAAACRTCRGALTIACKNGCATDAVLASIRKRQADARKWLNARRTNLERLSGTKHRSVMFCSTARLDLVFAPTKIDGCPHRVPHLQMHLYATRIEAARTRFLEVLGLTDADFPPEPDVNKTVGGGSGAAAPASPHLHIYLLSDEKLHHRVCPPLTGIVHQGVGVKQLGGKALYALHHDPKLLPDDAELHRNLIHNVTHLLLANLTPIGWIGDSGHGWLDAGIAHWFEDSLGGGCTNFCYLERSQPPQQFHGGQWRTAVRGMLDKGTLPPLAELLTRNASDLDFAQHALSFALVDHLIAAETNEKGRLLRLIRAAKENSTTEHALNQIYDIDLAELDRAFRQWVTTTYTER